MATDAQVNSSTKKVLIASLLPDTGHLTPLYLIAQKLMSNNISVLAIVPQEAKPLSEKFDVPAKYVGPTVPKDGREYISKMSQSNFMMRSFLYGALFHDRYIVPLTENGLREFPKLLSLSKEFAPDLILCDTHMFEEEYKNLASQLDCPIVLHYSKGSNYYAQDRKLWEQPETVYHLRRKLSRYYRPLYYRIKQLFFKNHLKEKSRSDKFIENFRKYNCLSSKGNETYLTTGIAGIERKYVGGLINLLDPSIKQFGVLKPYDHWSSASDVKSWLDKSNNHGVVYISFGTMISPPDRKLKPIVRAILKHNVRILISTSVRPEFTKHYSEENLLWRSWVPQTSVLGHESVKAFVSHAGATSVQETLWHGKPMMCLPGLWDQTYGAWFMEKVGAGVWMGNSIRRVKSVNKCVDFLLNDEKIKKNIRSLSEEVRASEANDDLVQEIKNVMQ